MELGRASSGVGSADTTLDDSPSLSRPSRPSTRFSSFGFVDLLPDGSPQRPASPWGRALSPRTGSLDVPGTRRRFSTTSSASSDPQLPRRASYCSWSPSLQSDQGRKTNRESTRGSAERISSSRLFSIRRSGIRNSVSVDQSIARHSFTPPDPTGVAVARSRYAKMRVHFTNFCKAVIDNKVVTGFMTALTLYVLVGDDIRLSAFDASADNVFDWITIVSFCLFSAELGLQTVAKDGYFLGFWFWADLCASASLILDLKVVADAMMDNPTITVEHASAGGNAASADQTEYARASRSSRLGTRVARLLRVVRLVRMSRVIRCFQSFVTNRTDSSEVAPGEPAYLREGEAESRVGRKLSERTTTRVIVLVLVMLVVVPQLQQSEFTVMMDPGAQYGANVLLEAWRQYELTALESPQAAALLDQKRWEWELEMLTYIYYHNWHAEACPTSNCASEWLDKLCWVGFVHRSDAVLDAVDVTSQAYIKAIAESGTEWDTLLADGDPHRRMGYAVGSLPENVKAALSRPWDAPCDEAGSSSRIQGVSLIPGLPCPRQELRKQETVWYVPQVYDKAFFVNHMEAQFVLVYDLRDYVRAEANFNILQTAFVVLVLGIAALLFSRDVDRLVLHPIEKMIRKVEIIRKDWTRCTPSSSATSSPASATWIMARGSGRSRCSRSSAGRGGVGCLAGLCQDARTMRGRQSREGRRPQRLPGMRQDGGKLRQG
ncbi:unnamed protein product [Prorocentrum cordatum]|uniref:Ion transport domain-containing protein n=1 Tax=Prorocentrum cordatum TaxID=2364126 RepID=A0ABN9X707_9DINO|nr:unnamed protein product [Polarella glacialis]